MKTKFNLKLLSATVLLSIPFVAEASLGKLQLHSHLNQPFSGTVVVDGNDAQTIINTPNVISISGNQYIHASPYRKGDKVVVSLTSSNVVNDPVVSFSLRVGNSIRYYSTLLDPQQADVNSSSSAIPNIVVGIPSVSHGTVVPPITTSGSMKQPSSTNIQRVVPEDGAHTAEGNVIPGKVYITHPGDTIIAIARSVQPRNLTLSQTMKAIVSANRNIFRGGNTNLLYVGAHVRIPTYTEMAKLASGVGVSDKVKVSKSTVDKTVEPVTVAIKPTKQKPATPTVNPIENKQAEAKTYESKVKHDVEKAQKVESAPAEDATSDHTQEVQPVAPIQNTGVNDQTNNTQTAPVPSPNTDSQNINEQEQSGDIISNIINIVSSFWQYILGGIVVLILLILGLLFARRKKDKVESLDDGVAIHHTIPPASEPPVFKPAPSPITPQTPPVSAGSVISSFEPEQAVEESTIPDSSGNVLGNSLNLGEESWDDNLSIDDTLLSDEPSVHGDELDDNTFSDLMDVDLGSDDFNQELPTHNSLQEPEEEVDHSNVHDDLANLELPKEDSFSTDFSTDFDVSTEKVETPVSEFNISQQESGVVTPLVDKEGLLSDIPSEAEPAHHESFDISENDLNVAFEDAAVSRRKTSIEDQLATGQEQLEYNPSLDFNLDDFDTKPEVTSESVVEPEPLSPIVEDTVSDNSSALEWDFAPTPVEEKAVTSESVSESAFVAKDMPSLDLDTSEDVVSTSSDDGLSLDFNIQVSQNEPEQQPQASTDQGFDLSELDNLSIAQTTSSQEEYTSVTDTSDSLDFNVSETGFDFKPEETTTSTIEPVVDENILDLSSFNTVSDSSKPEVQAEIANVLDDTVFLNMDEVSSQEVNVAHPHESSLELDAPESNDISFIDTASQEEPVLSSEDDFNTVQQSDNSMQEDFSVPLYAKLELAKMYLEANDHDGAEEVLMELAEESENTNPTVYAKVQELMAELNN